MAVIAPTPVSAPPDIPDRTARATFSARMYAAFVYLFGNFWTGVNGMGDNVFANATTAETEAATATAQAAIATAAALTATNALNATRWVTGTNYAQDQCVWSPLDYCIYQRISAGAGATDPANDPDNWATRSNLKTLLSGISVTEFTYNADNTLATMTYATGNKKVFTYAAGKLSTVEYYGTDGTTLLRTQTFTYTGNLLTAAPWS